MGGVKPTSDVRKARLNSLETGFGYLDFVNLAGCRKMSEQHRLGGKPERVSR